MPVTELALLRLNSPTFSLSPTTKATLHKAQKAQTAYSGHQLHFLRQVEDPCLFYVLGGWESVAKHNEDWFPSETNRGLLAELKDEVGVVWMFHIDVDPSTSTIPLDAPVIGISRYFVESGKKGEFESIFGASAPILGRSTAPYTYCGGWRVDKEGEDEEFVLLSGWNQVEDHFRFADSDAFRDVVKEAESRNVRIEKWE